MRTSTQLLLYKHTLCGMGCSNGKNLSKDSPEEFPETGSPSQGASRGAGRREGEAHSDLNLEIRSAEREGKGSAGEALEDQKPKKPPKPSERKKSGENLVTNGNKSNSSRYMHINHPRPTTQLKQQRPHSSPVIPASKYVGHLSRPVTNSTENVPVSDGRTPSSCDESDPELLTSIRASAAQKRAAVTQALTG